jgi:hypothetical protein
MRAGAVHYTAIMIWSTLPRIMSHRSKGLRMPTRRRTQISASPSYAGIASLAKNFAGYAESTNSSIFVISVPSSVKLRDNAYSLMYGPIFVSAALDACYVVT